MNPARAQSAGGEWTVHAAEALAVLLPLAVYLRTLARSVTFIDGGELAAAAAVLGIAHPPGYPLFTLLGHVFSLLPGGTVFFRVGLLSAVSMAAASGLVFRAGWMLSGAGGATMGKAADQGRPAGRPRALASVGALAGALLFAFADTPWSQAVIVEVYALHGLLVAAFLAAALAVADGSPRVPRWLPAFLLGLGLAHHLTAALLIPAALVLVVLAVTGRPPESTPRRWEPVSAWKSAIFSRWRGAAAMVAAVAAPLSFHLYLPIRSRMDPPVNWDYPETLHRFWIHVSAAQYRPILGSEGVKWSELGRFFGAQLPSEATLLLPILALVGLVSLARDRPRALAVTAPALAAFLLYNLAYPIHDLRAYYVPVLVVLALWAAAGAAWLGRRAARIRAPAGFAFAILLASLLAAGVARTAVRNFPRNDLSRRETAARFARDAVRGADPRAVVFSGDPDLFSEPMIYLQEVEKLRPDVVVLDIYRLESPMLARNLAEWYPELGQACRDEIQVIADYDWKEERGQPIDGARRESAYRAMLQRLARESVRLRPTYALGGAFRHPMFAGFQRHPEGLLVRLTPDSTYRAFPAPSFELPAALQGRPLGTEERLLLGEYRRMLDGRLQYLERHGRATEADTIRALLEAISAAS